MDAKQQQKTIGLYVKLMAEIKIRLASIDTATGGSLDVPNRLVREFCFLQLRMSCELVALACLVAHGDIKETQSKKLSKEWSAEKIFKRLETLHPNFFPHPSRISTKAVNRYFLQPSNSEFLTKTELINLYARCGDHLHRGSIRSLLTAKSRAQIRTSDIVEYQKKFYALLNVHLVSLHDDKSKIVCRLNSPHPNRDVEVAFAQATNNSEDL